MKRGSSVWSKRKQMQEPLLFFWGVPQKKDIMCHMNRFMRPSHCMDYSAHGLSSGDKIRQQTGDLTECIRLKALVSFIDVSSSLKRFIGGKTELHLLRVLPQNMHTWPVSDHRWPVGKIDGTGKWNKTRLNQWNPSFSQTNLKRTPMYVTHTHPPGSCPMAARLLWNRPAGAKSTFCCPAEDMVKAHVGHGHSSFGILIFFPNQSIPFLNPRYGSLRTHRVRQSDLNQGKYLGWR